VEVNGDNMEYKVMLHELQFDVTLSVKLIGFLIYQECNQARKWSFK